MGPNYSRSMILKFSTELESQNPADAPSRRSDYVCVDDEKAVVQLPSLQHQLQEVISQIGSIQELTGADAPPTDWRGALPGLNVVDSTNEGTRGCHT